MNQVSPNEIKIIFTFESQDIDIIKCNINEKLITIFKNYSKKIGTELNSLYFLCNGEKISDFEKTFEEIFNSENKKNMEINILVYKVSKSQIDEDSTINVYFLELKNTKRITCNRKDKIKNICKQYEMKTQFKSNSIIYKLNGIELDLEKSFDYYDRVNNDIFINVFSKTLIIILFSYLNALYNVECYKEDKIEDICSNFASKNNINKKKVIFKYKNNLIDKNKTLNHFLNENNISNINEIKIDVIDYKGFPSFLSIHKIKIIIIASITVVVSTTAAIVIPRLKKTDPDPDPDPDSDSLKCYPGYTLDRSQQCKIDYNIRATYFSEANEEVQLISDIFNLNNIKKMTIDGIITEPLKKITFNKAGNHTIYYSFIYYNKSLLSMNESSYMFSGIEKLLSAEISYFPLNLPNIRYFGMFNNCINLKNAIFIFLGKSPYLSYGYFSRLDYMFNNCISLTSLKIVADQNLSFGNSNYMFNNCISLKSINLSNLRFNCHESSDFNNMFSNCISLKTIILNYFSCAKPINMSYMFYNCSSLTSLVFSSNNVFIPEDMSYSFAYCSSLKELELNFQNTILENLGYTFKQIAMKSMSNAFKNCTSLLSIHLNFNTNYEDMSSLFMGCTSLKDINCSFIFDYSKKLNNMFYDCHALKSIKFFTKDFYTSFSNNYEFLEHNTLNLTDISKMFFGCSSLTSIDLSNFTTTNIINYEGLFYNCKKLSYINISSFTHNNLPSYNLSIFDDNYPINTIIIVNKEFSTRIKTPHNAKIIYE